MVVVPWLDRVILTLTSRIQDVRWVAVEDNIWSVPLFENVQRISTLYLYPTYPIDNPRQVLYPVNPAVSQIVQPTSSPISSASESLSTDALVNDRIEGSRST